MRAPHVIAAAILLTNTLQAVAADTYQVFPFGSNIRQLGGDKVGATYWAVVVNQTNGNIYWCVATYMYAVNDEVTDVTCEQGTIKDGGVHPPGIGALAPERSVPTNPAARPAIWSVDQNNGALTFCGGEVGGPPAFITSVWTCLTGRPLP